MVASRERVVAATEESAAKTARRTRREGSRARSVRARRMGACKFWRENASAARTAARRTVAFSSVRRGRMAAGNSCDKDALTGSWFLTLG